MRLCYSDMSSQHNVAAVRYRFFEPPANQAGSFVAVASEIEAKLRNEGHLVQYDVQRRGLWLFRLASKDKDSADSPAPEYPDGSFESSSITLSLTDEGAFEPAQLLRVRKPGSNATNASDGPLSAGLGLDPRSVAGSAPSSQATNASGSDSDQKGSVVGQRDTRSRAPVPLKDLYRCFIASVLGAISMAFCRQTGAIPLNPRTLVLLHKTLHRDCDDESHDAIVNVLATFRIYLTTAGTLVINMWLSMMDGFSTISESANEGDLSQGATILAAPLGLFATYQGTMDGEDQNMLEEGQGRSPATHVSRIRSDQDDKCLKWKVTVTKALRDRGVTFDPASWLSIQLFRMRLGDTRADGKRVPTRAPVRTILWPTSLCFRKKTADVPINNRLGDTMIVSRAENYDPLATVKSWFVEATEREEKMSKLRREQEIMAAKEAAAQQASGTSPLGRPRTTNNGMLPMTGVPYLTPPDGIQGPVGATPSMDGTVSTPGNHVGTTGPPDGGQTMATAGEGDEPYPDGWDGTDPKRDRGGSSFLPESSTLYGEMEADIFGDADVTDADFNFFDDQPDIDIPQTMDLSEQPSAQDARHQSKEDAKQDVQTAGKATVEPAQTPHGTGSFAKPELRHARSSLMGESRSHPEQGGSVQQIANGIKRQPSPFNPQVVFKRVRRQHAASGNFGRQPGTRQRSGFGRIDFDPFLNEEARKYEVGGRFDCNWSLGKMRDEPGPKTAPQTEYLRRHGKGNRRGGMLPKNMSCLFARIATTVVGGDSGGQSTPATKVEDPPSDADDVSLVSDQDDESETSDEPLSPAKSNYLRSRGDEDSRSMATSLKDPETAAASPYHSPENTNLPRAENSEVSLARYFVDPDPGSSGPVLPDDDFITVAQLVTEQAATGRLKIPNETENKWRAMVSRRDLATMTRRTIEALGSVVSLFLGQPASCQFRPYLDIRDMPMPGQRVQLQARPISNLGASGLDLARPNLYQIPAPHLEVKRAESRLSLLPSAVGFWESLGLGPCQGAKDIYAVCIFPSWKGMEDNAAELLDRLGSVYESLKLGTCERLPTTPAVSNGLLPYDVETISTSPDAVSSRSVLTDRMSTLSQALVSQQVSGRNFVVYFVYSTEQASSVVEACAAFQQLFVSYKKALSDRKLPASNELVLQLIPIDFVASSTELSIPTPADFVSLCFETYDRCTLFDGPMPAPAVVLEQAIPKIVEFRLSPTPSASPFHENSCIHVAYAQSVDERWVTAAWTDSRGCQQMTASYCLGRKGKPLSRSMNDVAREIWESTLELTATCRVHWRVVVTKCGPMHPQEMQMWMDLAQPAEHAKSNTSLILMTVDTNPALQLLPPPAKVPTTAPPTFYTTPVSTPQATAIVSPEQSGAQAPSTPVRETMQAPATTPGGGSSASAAADTINVVEPDADATIVEMADQAWGAVLAHRRSGSFSGSASGSGSGSAVAADASSLPAGPLVSGYLVKRGGSRAEDPPVLMEIGILHAEGCQPKFLEPLLREMLVTFRNLGTLARARGVIEREGDVRPWHVAAAEKANRALYFLM